LLDLSHNKIEFVFDDSIGALDNLLELNFSHNLLTFINAKVFEALFSLRTLKLDNNRLTNLDLQCFHEISRVTMIDISGELGFLMGVMAFEDSDGMFVDYRLTVTRKCSLETFLLVTER
jgi:hypothetical protein